MDLLQLYAWLASQSTPMTLADIAIATGMAEADIYPLLVDNTSTAFAYDAAADTWSAIPGYGQPTAPADQPINSLAELFLVATNPDELLQFLQNTTTTNAILAESDYYCRRFADVELPELVAKFGLDLATVPQANDYLNNISTNFRRIADFLAALKLRAEQSGNA